MRALLVPSVVIAGLIAASSFIAMARQPQQQPVAWLRAGSDSTSLVLIGSCSTGPGGGCGDRGGGPALEQEIAEHELVVSPSAQLTLRFVPEPDSVTLGSGGTRWVLAPGIAIDTTGTRLWLFTAPATPGVHDYTLAATWQPLGTSMTTAYRSALWRFVIRVQ